MARNNYTKSSMLVFALSLPLALAMIYFVFTMVKLLIKGYLAMENQGYPAWAVFIAAPPIVVGIGISMAGLFLRWLHDRLSGSGNGNLRSLSSTTGFKFMTITALVLTGLIGGAYDFATQGSDSPLVWAFDGRFASLFWVAVIGIVIWSLSPPRAVERDNVGG